MKTPIFVRASSKEERESLKEGLRSKDTFTMRRSQMLLASSRGERAPKIALNVGCSSRTVHEAIPDFNGRSILTLQVKSSRPKRTRDAFDRKSAEALGEMLHRSPREFGYQRSLWTLALASEAAFEEGLTEERLSGETVRATLSRLLGVRWMRAKRWITSPDPLYERKKASEAIDRLMEVAGADPEWAVGLLEECWWRRVALPTLSTPSPRRASPHASSNGRSPRTAPAKLRKP